MACIGFITLTLIGEQAPFFSERTIQRAILEAGENRHYKVGNVKKIKKAIGQSFIL